jgi:hypothetical protein
VVFVRCRFLDAGKEWRVTTDDRRLRSISSSHYDGMQAIMLVISFSAFTHRYAISHSRLEQRSVRGRNRRMMMPRLRREAIDVSVRDHCATATGVFTQRAWATIQVCVNDSTDSVMIVNSALARHDRTSC